MSADFERSSNRTLTIAAGDTASTGTVTITADDNDEYAPDRRVTVSATASNDLGVAGPADRPLTITEDDLPPELDGLCDDHDAGVEGGSSAQFTLRVVASERPGAGANVQFQATSTSQGLTDHYPRSEVAVVSEDYGRFLIRQSVTSGRFSEDSGGGVAYERTVTVNVLDDDTRERDERFLLRMSRLELVEAGDASNVLATVDLDAARHTRQARVRIEDNETGVLPGFTPGDAATFTLSRTGDVTHGLEVEVTVSQTGEVISGTAPTRVEFEEGSEYAWLSVATAEDEVAGEGGTITATVTAKQGAYTVGAEASAEVTVIDDEQVGLALADAEDLETDEGGATDTFTVALGSKPAGAVTVEVARSAETEGTVAPQSLPFTATDWSTPQTVTLTGVNDDAEDGDQTYEIQFTLSNSADANYGALQVAPVAALNRDNDVLPTITIAADAEPIIEGDDAVFTLSRTGILGQALTVEVTVSESQAMLAASGWSPARHRSCAMPPAPTTGSVLSAAAAVWQPDSVGRSPASKGYLPERLGKCQIRVSVRNGAV